MRLPSDTAQSLAEQNPVIGFVAPSAVVPRVQFEIGLQVIQQHGFSLQVHPQCHARQGMYAGGHEERAQAFFDFAISPEVDVLWAARGGYGANYLLPYLDQFSNLHGKPPIKLLVGYSDTTALFEYVRRQWGWSTLHAPMPSLREFALLKPRELQPLFSWISRKKDVQPFWENLDLRWLEPATAREVKGVIEGGNLSVWASLFGSRFQPDPREKILFFEEVGETFGRIDRILQQLRLAGVFESCAALVFGEFKDCRDAAPQMLGKKPAADLKPAQLQRFLSQAKPKDLKPLRPLLSEKKYLQESLGLIARDFDLPIAMGLPMGHGKSQSALPLGAEAILSQVKGKARLKVKYWDWNQS